MKKYALLLIYILVVKKTMLNSHAVYTDVFPNYSVFACELITIYFCRLTDSYDKMLVNITFHRKS